MHATIPIRKKVNDADRHLMAPSYRLAMIRSASEVLLRAGVSDRKAKVMMLKITAVYPPPTKKELYDEQINDPLTVMALGERRKELSYYRTGKHEWTDQDAQLIEECLDDLMERTKKDHTLMDQFSKLVLGPRSGADGL